MSLRALVLAILIAGCHHDPPPAPPATPEPRTPVGYLLGAASELQLRDDQVARLKELDAGLAQQLATLDPQIAAAMKKAQESGDAQSTAPSTGGGTRGMRGMGGMGGMGGGMGGGGMGGRRGNRGCGGSGARSSGDKGDALDRLLAQRASDVRATLALALAALDPKQQVIAKKQLVDHDVDLDDAEGDTSSGGDTDGSGHTNGSGNTDGDKTDGSGK